MRVQVVFSKTVFTNVVGPDGRYQEEDLHLGTPFTRTRDPPKKYVQPPNTPRMTKQQLDHVPKVLKEYKISYLIHREVEHKRQVQALAQALGENAAGTLDDKTETNNDDNGDVVELQPPATYRKLNERD